MLALPIYWTRRSMFIRGIRRTTLFFGVWMAIISFLLWADLTVGFLPLPPWAAEAWPVLVGLPPCLLILNVLKRPDLNTTNTNVKYYK